MKRRVTFNNLITIISCVFIVLFVFINNTYAQTIGAVTVSGSPGCGAGSVTLTASGGAPSGGTYNWYTASTGGTAIATGATYLPQTSGTYYASYTSGGIASLRVSGTATIVANPIIATAQSVTAGATLALPFTNASTNDVSGNGNNGIVEGSPTAAQPTTDRFGAANNAYSFDGVSQYITTKTNIATAPQNFSISLWFNTTTTTGGKLAGWGNQQTGSSGNDDHHIYMNNAGQVYFGVYYNGFRYVNTNASYNDGKWHHVAVTFSSTNGVKMYVDAVIVGEDPTNKIAETEAGYWRFGYDNLQNWPSAPTSYFYKGLLDDIALFDHALTDADVYALYGGGAYQLCDGSVQLLANTVANSTYAWTGPNGFTSTLQNPINTGAGAVGAYTVTVKQNGQCTSTLNISVNTPVVYTWTGNQSSDITLTNNWNNTTFGISNQLPFFDGSVALVIPNVTTRPQLTQSISVYNLTLNSGAKMDLNGQTLTVGCNIINNGTINYSSSTFPTVIFNGTTATQTYTGSNTLNTAEFGNLTINNTYSTVSGGVTTYGKVSIKGGPVDVFNTLTMTKGNLFVDNANTGVLTLKSTANLTASVAVVPSTSTISGTVSAERFLVGGQYHRGYRLLSSPVYAATVSSNVYSLNYLQNNVVITGFQNGGFDKTGNPTIYLFREDLPPSNATFISGNFWGISAINNTPSYNYYLNGLTTNYNIPVGGGFMFFFRGNKASASLAAETVSTYIPVSVAVTATGTLNQGQVIARDWYTPTSQFLGNTGSGTGATTNGAVRGYNLVGNPYASSIDWETYNTSTTTTGIYANNVGNTIYEFNDVTYNYDTYQKGGARTNNGSNIIASGQGFYVSATNATNSQLIFNETAKTSSQNTGAALFMALRPHNANAATAATPVINQYLRIQLAKDSINTDDIYIGLDQTAKNGYVFDEDAAYHPGGGQVSLASKSSDGISLAINKLPLPALGGTTIPLVVNATADGVYKLNRTELQSIPALYEIWLMDAYTKDSLDMRNNATYAFNLTLADTNSYGSKRFSLVIRENQALKVHLLSFAGSKVTQGSQITWTTENEANYTTFTVQRSIDNGVTFTAIDSLLSDGQGAYSFLDKNPINGVNLYRLKVLAVDSTVSYSNIVRLVYGNSANMPNVIIYPNPTSGIVNVTVVQNNATSLQTPSTGTKLYDIKIISISGVVVLTGTMTQSVWQNNVSSLSPGTYIVRVLNDSNKSLVGEASLIKR